MTANTVVSYILKFNVVSELKSNYQLSIVDLRFSSSDPLCARIAARRARSTRKWWLAPLNSAPCSMIIAERRVHRGASRRYESVRLTEKKKKYFADNVTVHLVTFYLTKHIK